MPKPRSRAATNSKQSQRRKSVFSGIAGAGSGSGIVVWVQSLATTESTKIVLTALAPWVTLIIAALGPVVATILLNIARFQGIKFMRWQLKRHLAQIPADEASKPHREKAEENIRELDQALTEILNDSAAIFRVDTTR